MVDSNFGFGLGRYRLAETSAVVLLPRLTLLLLALTVNHDLWRAGFAFAVFALAFVKPAIYLDGRFWLVIGAVMAVWNWAQWHLIDNHIFLANYWYLVLGLALLSPDPNRIMAFNAKALVGIAFSFAVLWKFISPDFLSGNFFEFTLLTDVRFEFPAQVLGMDAADLASNRAVVSAGAGTLSSAGGISTMATVLTWAALTFEAAVAATFLLPKFGRARNWALAAFAIPTYLLVPVAGFGGTLFVLGAAAANSTPTRRRYALAFGIIVVWSILWQVLFG